MSDPATYTVGWICAIRTEYTAARQFLDEEYALPSNVSRNDNNAYTLGRIGQHRVVIALLPIGGYGTTNAAAAARDMLHTFPNVKIGLLVGIAGAAPSGKQDIRLGDVVVSCPQGDRSGVMQYDFGKSVQDQGFRQSGHLNQPQPLLLAVVNDLASRYESDGNEIHETVVAILAKKTKMKRGFQRPDLSTDRLFVSSFIHTDVEKSCDEICVAAEDEGLDVVVKRETRDEDQDNPRVFYGLIASANRVMKDAKIRDSYAAIYDVLCFEMEAAGLMNHFPCLVIRGICDYSDSHKNKEWQGYAAMTAAAYAKDLLSRIAPQQVEAEKSLSKHLSSIGEEVADIKTFLHDSRRDEKILSWLSAPDPCSNNFKATRQRHPHTGQWLLQHSSYLKWKAARNSFLWLHGIPGCGKTVLCSTIIEDLQRQNSAPLTIYFYFDFSDDQKQSLQYALRSLVRQLYTQSEAVRDDFLDPNLGQQPSVDSLCAVFQNVVEQVGEVWVVLDALDECHSQKEDPKGGLLQWIENLQSSSNVNAHFLVSSRPDKSIEDFVAGRANRQNTTTIKIESDSVKDFIKHDIHTYVHDMLGQHSGLQRWRRSPEVQDMILNTLLTKADGMFRWVSCQLDAIANCRDFHSLEGTLESLPKDLDETYDRILKRIPPESTRAALRLLQFLTFSKRPLKIDEAVDAIAVTTKREPHFHTKYRMPDPGEITEYCASLIIVVEEKDCHDGKGGTTIQLAHFSVKEYLASARLEDDFALDLNETVSKGSIAEVCLAYWLAVADKRSSKQIAESFPLARYAARYWASHALVGGVANEKVHRLAKEFFSSPNCFEACYQLHVVDSPFVFESEDEHNQRLQSPECAGTALYYASFEGLQSCVEGLLAENADPNIYGGYFGYPLQAASFSGHMGIVTVLLDHGADVNAAGGWFSTALQAASSAGHEAVVQSLLDHGANLNILGGQYGTALQAASSAGHFEVVMMLLRHGADVSLAGGECRTALQAATSRGHSRIAQILLDQGAGH